MKYGIWPRRLNVVSAIPFSFIQLSIRHVEHICWTTRWCLLSHVCECQSYVFQIKPKTLRHLFAGSLQTLCVIFCHRLVCSCIGCYCQLHPYACTHMHIHILAHPYAHHMHMRSHHVTTVPDWQHLRPSEPSFCYILTDCVFGSKNHYQKCWKQDYTSLDNN